MLKCLMCDGEGEIDTGGAEPWGAWISETCPLCEGKGMMMNIYVVMIRPVDPKGDTYLAHIVGASRDLLAAIEMGISESSEIALPGLGELEVLIYQFSEMLLSIEDVISLDNFKAEGRLEPRSVIRRKIIQRKAK